MVSGGKVVFSKNRAMVAKKTNISTIQWLGVSTNIFTKRERDRYTAPHYILEDVTVRADIRP